MLFAVLALLLGAPPAPITCPSGTTAKQRSTPEAREAWCETAAGVRQGPRAAWYPDGARWFEGMYREGKRSDAWRFWYASGSPMSVGSYVADKRHGPSEHWHDGGARAMAGACVDGVEDGLWVRWSPSGAKEIEIVFAEGKPKTRTYYSRRGQVVDLEGFLAEKLRGASGEKATKERERWGQGRVFDECGQ